MPRDTLLEAAPANTEVEQKVTEPKAGESSSAVGEQKVADWKLNIPEAIRGEKTWEKHKDIGSALQSLHHLEKKMGSAINIPTDKSTPEEVAAFHEKLGVPKTAKEYTYTEPKLPEGITWEKDGLGAFADAAHKLHLTPAQMQGILDYYGNTLGTKFQSVVEGHSKGTEALKKDWGASFEDKLGEAHSALKAYDPKGDFKTAMREAGVDNDPRVLRFLQSIGAETSEHTSIKGERQTSMTKEDAAKKVDEIQKADKAHPLYNAKDPKHKDAVEEYRELLKVASS